MRFNQLKKNPNAIIRKRLYKKGKRWVVASSLAIASGLIFLGASGMSVQADAVSDNVTQGQTASGVAGVTATKETMSNDSEPSATDGSKNVDSTGNGNNTQKVAEPEKTPDQTPDQTQITGAGTGTSSETSSNDGTEGTVSPQDSNEITSTGDSVTSETQKSQDATYVNYDPNNSVYTDTSDWDSSNSNNTIADDQVPPEIMKEGISQRGMDGTSPYFITNAKNLYFLNGTLSTNYTKSLFGNSDFMKANVLNIDTSLAKKVYLPENSDSIFSELGSEAMGIPTSEFYFPEYAPKLNLFNIDTSKVMSMKYMFSGSHIPSLDLSSFDTSHVKDMTGMFQGFSGSSLDLSSLDTSMVTSMSSMFSGSEITSLDLKNLNTSNVKNMSNMFSLAVFPSLNLSSFDTSNVTDMSYMFSNTSVPELDLSNFNTSKVQTMKEMFDELNTAQVYKDGAMVYLLSPANLNVSSFRGDALSVQGAIDNMFSSARVTNINMPNFKVDSDKITSAVSTFQSTAADTVSIPNFDGSKIKDWTRAFEEANINKLDISKWNMSPVSGAEMFYGAIIKQISLGPTNKFLKDTNLAFKENEDGSGVPALDNKWVSISKDGVVDPTMTFYARSISEDGHYGVDHYYDGSGKTGVKTFVPDVDITDKVTLNVPTTVDGKADEDVTYPDLYGKVGVPITLDVPEKKGYQADKKTITATVTDNGITIDDVINYTKIPIGGTGGTSQNIFISDRPQVATTPQRISIYPDQGNVTLYKQEGQKFVPITNRELVAGSGWYYDKVAHVGSENSDMKYYRVSTNEWVRANQAYLYQPNKVVIRTKAGDPKQLIHAEGTLATSRMISPNTDWYSDLIGDLGEGQYYRVATNEFVNKADVTVIRNA